LSFLSQATYGEFEVEADSLEAVVHHPDELQDELVLPHVVAVLNHELLAACCRLEVLARGVQASLRQQKGDADDDDDDDDEEEEQEQEQEGQQLM
jgi:hypothetical protein